ncbi:MAG: hypothetical protein HYV78_01140 [Candidatus Wildermuthbacteria bacterium]|nr:hypothetical protein [Candidatus Wildermuthbacteria bacterium]
MYADSDGDGYAASTTKYFSATSTATGYVRTVSASGTSDPNDSTASCWQNKYADTDGDGYGAGSAVCVGNDAGYVSNNTDCSASDAAKWQNLAGYADSDTDTYTTGDSQSVCSGSSLPSGYLASANGSDCNDGNGYVYQTVASLVTDGDNDGYSTGASGSQCVGSTSVVSGRTYYKNTSNASSWLASASSLGTDCSDSDGALYQNLTGYPDADGDAYYSQSSQSVCSGGSLPAGYSASQGNDCYDANANAKPGQTSLFFTNRGDGSFDYDCNGSLTYAYTYTCEYGNNLYACSSPYNGTYCNYNPVSEACYSCFNSAYLCTSATISCPVGGGCGTYVATTSVFIDENCSAGRFKALEQSCR